MSSILKSSDLIKSIKMRGFIPESQETFTSDSFLEIATEKINIDLMYQLMVARGDYLIYSVDVPLIPGTQSYAIPDRAHGNKLREASIVDSDGKTQRQLTQVDLQDLGDYERTFSTYTSFDPFYLQNNNVVLINTNYSTTQSIRMYFYMRPNKLVLESRAATVSSSSNIYEVDNISPKSGIVSAISILGVITSVAHGLASGDTIILSGTDCIPSIDGTRTITVLDSDTFTYTGISVSVAGTTGTFNLAAQVVSLSTALFPKHFTSELYYDVVSSISPNNIILYNLTANSVNGTLKTMNFRVKDVGAKLVKGCYITKSEETIVPNIPTEYHPLLAQMVSVHCMESMADEQQKRSAQATLEKMEKAILGIVSNRVEGAPKKINNRNSTLKSAVSKGRFHRRG